MSTDYCPNGVYCKWEDLLRQIASFHARGGHVLLTGNVEGVMVNSELVEGHL